MIEVKIAYEIKGKTVGYYCHDANGNRARLEPAELKHYIRAGQVVNARLSDNKICLADGVRVRNVHFDETGSYKREIKGAVYRMEEIMTGRKKRDYIQADFYRTENTVYETAYVCSMQLDDLDDRDWYHPKIQPAINLMLELAKHPEWNYSQQFPCINQLYNIVRTWR